jgi:hypothetical protein
MFREPAGLGFPKIEREAMSRKISRREFALGAAGALAATALPQDAKLAKGKPTTPAEAMADADLRSLESKLAAPLPPKLKGPAKTALTNARNTHKERLKFSLPEGSEPCTVFVPLPARGWGRR